MSTFLNLPSHYQIDQEIDVDFGNSKYLKSCRVAAIKFTNCGKVLYDITVPVGFDTESMTLFEIDSALITAPIEKIIEEA